MTSHLPKEVLEGLHNAQKRERRTKNRLRLVVGDTELSILRYWEDGLAMESNTAPHLRGLVDIYDGSIHVAQCLIICSSTEGFERIYEFKRNTPAAEAPAVDFVKDVHAPVALLT
jgi:hypothetical protein